MAVGVAKDCAFIPTLAAWFAQAYARERWAEMVVFLPTARAASRLRSQLAQGGAGILPLVVPLGGSEVLAERLGMAMPGACDAWAGRGELARWWRNREGLTPRGWRGVDDLWRTMNRLALHGLGARDLRRALPEAMLGYWETQAATLLDAMAHMQSWLKARGEVLPGEAERLVLVRAGEVLAGNDVVVAGVVDAPAPAAALVKALVAKGAEVVVPEAVGGYVEVVEAWLEACGTQMEHVVGTASEAAAVEEIVAQNGWEEARQAALAVRKAVARGDARVAVICPQRGVAALVRGELATLGIAAFDSAADSLAEAAAGRRVLAELEAAAERLGDSEDVAVSWRGRVVGEVDEPRVRLALDKVDGVKVPMTAGVYAALVDSALGEAAAPAAAVTPGVWILGALEARLLDFETVVVANMVEGVWPAAGGDGWLSEAHLRAVGLADSHKRAALAAAEWQGLAHGGSGAVVVTRARMDGEKELVRSRLLAGERVVAGRCVAGERVVEEQEALGCFVPQGGQWPREWSASLIEDLLACPYKALGQRVLKLEPLDPLVPQPDARVGGRLAHRWLELAGKEIRHVDEANAEEAVARLLDLSETVLADADAVTAALWRLRFANLAPALVQAWLRHGRPVSAVEDKRTKAVGPVTVTARFDRVEDGGDGAVIIDYKTTQPPTWKAVEAGEKPQLALEAWLMGEAARAEFWQLRGYGPKPVQIAVAGPQRLAAMVEPVAEGVARLVEAFGDGKAFPAVPNKSGGGACKYCALAGVCRKQAA